MRQALCIARWDVRRATRDRTFWVLPLVSIPLLASFQRLNFFGVAVGPKVLTDFSLTVIRLIGLLIAGALAATSLTQERQQGTMSFSLSKPVSHATLVAGKFTALALILSVLLTVVAGQVFAMVYLHGGRPDPGLAAALYILLMELVTFASLVMLISAVSSLVVTASLAILLAAVASDVSAAQAAVSSGAPAAFGAAVSALFAVLPDLSHFDVSIPVVHGHGVPAGYLLRVSAYAIAHVAVYLRLAGWALARSFA